MNKNSGEPRKTFTPVHELQSFTPVTASTSSPTPTILAPLPPSIMDSPISSPGKSPRFIRPTSILIPPPTGHVFYYLRDVDLSGGSSVYPPPEEEIEDEEISDFSERHCAEYENDSLVVLPTFYTRYEEENLLFSSNLKIPAIIIPEERIRTPRTPRTPSNRKTVTHSPSDQMLLTQQEQKSPSEIMKGKYKANFYTQRFQL